MRLTNGQTLQGSRETEHLELTLEFIYQRPYPEVRRLAEDAKVPDTELRALAQTVFDDMARVMRGELSSIHVPNRLPFPGEYTGRTH